jgi:predicted NBD/HSP70 family sugar kinase
MPKIANIWLRSILSTIYQRGQMTRTEILQATGLNAASVSHALRYLLGTGTILKLGEIQSRGGRRSEVLKLNSDAAYFVAIDLEGTRIRIAFTNLVGDVRYRWEEDIEWGKPLEMKRIRYGVKMVLRNLRAPQRSRLVAAGISYPGIGDRQGSITAVNLGWQKVDLAGEMQEACGVPVFLEHSHRTCIIAERLVGCAQGSDNCVYVEVGQGIGASIISDGCHLAGRDRMAGELGHMVVDPDAKDRCKCGNYGCLESIASSPNVVRQYLADTKGQPHHLIGSKVGRVFERAQHGDKAALKVLDRVGSVLGIGLANLVNLLNPELIILGGDLPKGESVLLPRIKKELQRHAIRDFSEGLQIRVSSLGPDIRLMGATFLAFRNCLLYPQLLKKLCEPVIVVSSQQAVNLSGNTRTRLTAANVPIAAYREIPGNAARLERAKR